MRDSRNIEIRAGQRVAYNFSGDVALGDVLDVQRGHVKIAWFEGGPGRTGHISRVRNGRSILVLAAGDCVELL